MANVRATASAPARSHPRAPAAAVKMTRGPRSATPAAAINVFLPSSGSLSVAAGETFVAAAEAAVARSAALVIFTAAAGARMQEGALALTQMARTTLAINLLRTKRLPYLVVLTDPTIGGVTASYAMLGNLHPASSAACCRRLHRAPG